MSIHSSSPQTESISQAHKVADVQEVDCCIVGGEPAGADPSSGSGATADSLYPVCSIIGATKHHQNLPLIISHLNFLHS
ncbi:MAG TPA: hypothetical protein V6C84_14240 [Coleofasciculaceae cyanobacterium]